MKFNFKKIASVIASTVMLSSTLALAAAANYPAPFTPNVADVAVVYPSSALADPGDLLAATKISTDLTSRLATGGATTVVTAGTIKLTDDEVTLGGSILGGDINSPILDNKLSTLMDDKISWDDGDGSDDYDVHEAIYIGTMEVLTTLDDKKLDGVALSNEQALEYRFVFDEALDTTKVGSDDADTLYLPIMGKEYEIEDMNTTTDSITVTTSDEVSMAIGSTTAVAGKTVTLVDVFDGSVEVSVDGTDKVISEGDTLKVNGIRIEVENVGYHSTTPETSKAILKVGEDISKTYSDGEEFIGQDEDDPLWVWHIVNPGDATGYIGVKYNAKINSANDEIAGDSIKYVGEGYVLPNNYAAVTLDSITDAKYQDLKVYFDDATDLFANATGSTYVAESAKVLVIEGDKEDTLTPSGTSIETDKMYVFFNTTSGKFQTFYRDLNGDFDPTNRARTANAAATAAVTNGALSSTELATVVIGDTNLDIDISVTAKVATLSITNDDAGGVLALTLGGTAINATASTGTLERLGATKEDSEAGDIAFNGTDVSLEDYAYMDTYGIKLSDGTTVNDEGDDDMATLSVPEEQVYAQVTVSTGDVTVTPEQGTVALLAKDSEVISAKNLIVVGGSCINTVAANLLGGALCGADFTTATGIGAGQFLIKTFANPDVTGGIATLVAGYNAGDTTSAATYLTTQTVDTTVGSIIKKTAVTYATVA